LLLILSNSFAFGQEFVKIRGIAPAFVGESIGAFEIQDYLSDIESKMSSCIVQSDSTFELIFKIEETQKVILRVKNNRAYLYAEPSGNYTVYFPEKDAYSPVLKSGNQVELTFMDLQPNDINYKILSFQRWQDEYVSKYYSLKSVQPIKFVQKLDTFKMYIENAYKSDTSIFFLNFIRFSVANIDEIEFAASRNRYEKYDFYIRPSPVFYRNDIYMDYVKRYYRNLIPRLSNQTNNDVYLAVLKASPTAVMKAFGTEYSLQNLRIRELVCIQSLSEQFYKDDFPQTNILTILDSLSKRALFAEHRQIAANMITRLTQLVAGARIPNFTLTSTTNEIETNLNFKGKHLYIHFYDPTSNQNKKELPLLLGLYEKYSNAVEFITIVSGNSLDYTDLNFPWKTFYTSENPDLTKLFQIRTFPQYALVDAQGYLVSSPALGPTPNAQYETIERSFFYIHKKKEELEKE
jgi:thiol-disulfide isomerase/thioredoxin